MFKMRINDGEVH